MPEKRECGFVLCKNGKQFARGPITCGTQHNVTLLNICPPGHLPHATQHNHPSGNNKPSGLDIDTCKKHKIPYVCVKTDKGTKCHKVDL